MHLDGLDPVLAVADSPRVPDTELENLTGLIGTASLGHGPPEAPPRAARPPDHVVAHQRHKRLGITHTERLIRLPKNVGGHRSDLTRGAQRSRSRETRRALLGRASS